MGATVIDGTSIYINMKPVASSIYFVSSLCTACTPMERLLLTVQDPISSVLGDEKTRLAVILKVSAAR